MGEGFTDQGMGGRRSRGYLLLFAPILGRGGGLMFAWKQRVVTTCFAEGLLASNLGRSGSQDLNSHQVPQILSLSDNIVYFRSLPVRHMFVSMLLFIQVEAFQATFIINSYCLLCGSMCQDCTHSEADLFILHWDSSHLVSVSCLLLF